MCLERLVETRAKVIMEIMAITATATVRKTMVLVITTIIRKQQGVSSLRCTGNDLQTYSAGL